MSRDADDLGFVFNYDAQKQNIHRQAADEGRYADVVAGVETEEDFIRSLPSPPQRLTWGSLGRIALTRLKQNVARRSAIWRSFGVSGCATAVVLIGSVGVIPFAQYLRCYKIWAWVVLVVGWLLFAGCIALYGIVIARALGFWPRKKK